MNYIPYSRQKIEDDDIAAVCAALKDDVITGGSKVDDFERALCDYTGAKFAVAMNSATSALHAGYIALGLSEGDEVITTPITFAATANAALMCGADARFAGVLENGNIDPASVEALVSPRTKIITPVDFGGLPVDMPALKNVAQKHNLKILEDASHALGSSVGGRKVGTFADATVFSFHAIKPITTLEGGALLTDDEEIARKARLIRSHGIVKKQAWNSDMLMMGYNYRLTDVACALGLSQLKKLDRFIAAREEIARYYDERFENCEFLAPVRVPAGVRSSRHLYVARLASPLWRSKEEIYEALHERGVGVQVHYKPTYQFSFYKARYGENFVQSAEDFYKSELSLPCQQTMSLEDARYVADTVIDVLSRFAGGCKA